MRLEDLRRVDSEDGDYVTINRVSEPASIDDLIAVLVERGVLTEIRWCETHGAEADPGRDRCRPTDFYDNDPGPCRIATRLITDTPEDT